MRLTIDHVRQESYVIGTFDRRVLDLREFEKTLDRAVSDNIVEREMPKVLYHYTNWNAAKGILESKQFWFTAHDCTNDPAELTTADNAIVEIAKDIHNTVGEPAREVLGSLLNNYNHSRISRRTTSCLACFSLAKDSESQWKRYGDDGRGLCLCIKVLEEPQPANSGLRFFAARVQYAESSWRQRVKKGFRAVCSEISAATAQHGPLVL